MKNISPIIYKRKLIDTIDTLSYEIWWDMYKLMVWDGKIGTIFLRHWANTLNEALEE